MDIHGACVIIIFRKDFEDQIEEESIQSRIDELKKAGSWISLDELKETIHNNVLLKQ